MPHATMERPTQVQLGDTQFTGLASQAMDKLANFLSDDEPSSKAIGAARIAASVLSAWTRHKQTEGAREATTFMIARELATNKEELRHYLAVAMPSHDLTKALPAPKGE